jgi:hypothetical protein
MIEILLNAPLWAWFVLAGLIVLGGLQTMPRRLPLAAILVLPVAMGALSLYSVGVSFADHVASFGAWGTGALVALMLNGLMLRSPGGVRYDAGARRFELPGSFTPLALMLVIFATRFAITATTTVNPAVAADAGFVIATSAALGFLAGLFASRALVIVSAPRAVTVPA